MKHMGKFLSVSAALTLVLSGSPALPADAAANGTVKIMPLGDSITYGMADGGGYRKFLWQDLKQMGYDNIDFVGPEGQNSASFTYQGQTLTYDDNHAGYSGYTITDLPGGWFGQLHGILEKMQEGDYITKYAPDIILLQIGTNDVSNGHLDGSEERLHTLLDYLREKMPADGTIFLSTIPELGNTGWGGDNSANIAAYNQLVKKVAGEYSSKNVVFADIHSVIDASSDLADGVHPNAGGYEKMGKYWAEQLDGYLGGGGIPQPPVTEFIRGDLNADGRINAIDLTLAKRGILTGSFANDRAKKACDVNEDNRQDAKDVLQLREYLTAQITEFVKETPEIPVDISHERRQNYEGFPSVSSIAANKSIPDPFVFYTDKFSDKKTVETPEDWYDRASELSCMYEYYMYGKWRDGSDDEVTYKISGSSMTIYVKRKSTGKTASFPANINLPAKVRHEGGAPVIVGMHNNIAESTATAQGYAVITIGGTIFSNPVASDNTAHTGAFYELYPYGNSWEEQTGVLMAWSWGCSKILDALCNGAAKELNINPDNSIVTGVSRWGKATAVCGAFDTRFKMVAPSCSGAGGLALYRYMSEGKTYNFTSRGGSASYTYTQNEPLGSLQSTDERGWFNNRFLEFRSGDQFPMDQHLLGSLAADPNRYLFLIASCQGEDWVNAPSMWCSWLGMKHVWDFLGIGDHLAINIHLSGHAVIEEDVQKMCAFFDQHVYGMDTPVDLNALQTSVFDLPQNKDSFFDTFDDSWLH